MMRFNLHHLGRFGNQMFAYAFARGWCETHGLELHTDPWIGERIFEISHPRCEGDLPRRDENTLLPSDTDISYRSYSQRAGCAQYYTLSKLREWFKFRPEVEAAMAYWKPEPHWILAHLRRGDYVGENSIYPLIHVNSYHQAVVEHELPTDFLHWVEEERPAFDDKFTGELSLVPDFWRMAQAKMLLRANSSYSFWAGALAQANHGARVLSPVIDGLAGGREHHVQFIEGNGARIADLDFVEPIEIKP